MIVAYCFIFLPPASEGWGKVLFSVCLSVHISGGGTPVRSRGGTPSQVWSGGRGDPIPGLVGGYPGVHPMTRSGWGTPPGTGMGYPPRTWDGVPPLPGIGYPPGPGMGYPPRPGTGYPLLDLGQGTPPGLGQGTPPDLGRGTPPA